MTTDTVETPAAVQPEDLAEAKRWIVTLRAAYHREHDYVERLEQQVRNEEFVVSQAVYWHKARGAHRAPALLRLRDAIVEMLDRT